MPCLATDGEAAAAKMLAAADEDGRLSHRDDDDDEPGARERPGRKKPMRQDEYLTWLVGEDESHVMLAALENMSGSKLGNDVIVGTEVGLSDGIRVGPPVGPCVGTAVGSRVGSPDGSTEMVG